MHRRWSIITCIFILVCTNTSTLIYSLSCFLINLFLWFRSILNLCIVLIGLLFFFIIIFFIFIFIFIFLRILFLFQCCFFLVLILLFLFHLVCLILFDCLLWLHILFHFLLNYLFLLWNYLLLTLSLSFLLITNHASFVWFIYNLKLRSFVISCTIVFIGSYYIMILICNLNSIIIIIFSFFLIIFPFLFFIIFFFLDIVCLIRLVQFLNSTFLYWLLRLYISLCNHFFFSLI